MLTSTKSKSKKSTTAKKPAKKASKKSTVKKSTSEVTSEGGLVGHTLCAGLRVQAGTEADPNARREISFSLPGGSAYFISGMKTLNRRGEIVIHQISVGGIPLNVVREADAGFFNHRTYFWDAVVAKEQQCQVYMYGVGNPYEAYVEPPGFSPMPIGCVTTVSPLTISFSPVGNLPVRPYFEVLFEGIFKMNFGACGYPVT